MDKQTIDTYDKLAKEYDEETTSFWELFPSPFINAFADRIDGQVLNVGSGPGRDGLLLKSKGLNITCIDASKSMVEMCQARGLEAIQADFSALPFSDENFAGAWAYTSLLHVSKKDISIALDEIRRVLKTNGTLGLGMIEGNVEEYRLSTGVDLPRWFSFYTKEQLEKALASHGFEVVHFEQFKPRSKIYLNFIAKKI